MANNGLITLKSAFDFATTLERLLNVLNEKGVTIFSRLDHAAGAAGVGLSLRPTILVVFGNPAAGTPLMHATQTAGIDLPLKALVWEDSVGVVNLTYNDPSWIAARHEAGNQVSQTVTTMSAALRAFAAYATNA
jgi:uncharacterized protein (DUF302 family)